MARLRIGVFDSGVGGLTVVRQLLRLGAEIVYLADTARVPYGNRAPQTVRRYAFECVSYLVRQGVDLLVVACNTVSAVALDAVREAAGELPVAEVVTPAVAAAVEQTQTGHIGVIGTRAPLAAVCTSACSRSGEHGGYPRRHVRSLCRWWRRGGTSIR